jgi:adenylate cyclase class IV
VEGLGDFLELEVVLQPDEASEAGAAVASEFLKSLGVSPGQLVEKAYVDLLAKE